MGFLDTLKRFFAGETVGVQTSTASRSNTKKSTFTETVNGETKTTSIEIKHVDAEWLYIVNGVSYSVIADIPAEYRQRITEMAATL